MTEFKIGDKLLLKDPQPKDIYLSLRTTEILGGLSKPLTVTKVEKGWVILEKFGSWASASRFKLAEPEKEKEMLKDTIDIKPGDKLRLKDPLPDGHMYDEVWTAKLKKAGPIFTVKQSARVGTYRPRQGISLEGILFMPYSVRFELVQPKTIDDALEDSRDELDELEMTQKSLKAKSEQCKILENSLSINKSNLDRVNNIVSDLRIKLTGITSEKDECKIMLSMLEAANMVMKNTLDQKISDFNEIENRVLALTIERNDLRSKVETKEILKTGDTVYDKMTGKAGILIIHKGFGCGRVGIYRGANISRKKEDPRICSNKTNQTVHDTAFIETLTLTPPHSTNKWVIIMTIISLFVVSIALSSYITSLIML